jgi:hypothetical protein
MLGCVIPIVLDLRFRVWQYGVGHSQLVFHARAGDAGLDHVNVLFEDVRAVKLRSSYQPLILQPADESARADLLTFADIPPRHQARMLCLALPNDHAAPGFVVCARATVLVVPREAVGERFTAWPEGARPIHRLTQPRSSDPGQSADQVAHR